MSHYDYWNDFVDNWFKRKKPIPNWTDSDLLPLLNSLNPNYGPNPDYSSLYLPEPWWGNDGTRPLHSAVINFNPGVGGPNQLLKAIKKYIHGSYAQDIVANCPISLCTTKHWHFNNRALPILQSLERLGVIKEPYGLANHLSVELLPWHTEHVNTKYWNYLAQNIQAVYDHCICFAADMSRTIANKKLKNVVILRMSEGDTKKLINCLSTINKATCLGNVNVTASGNGKWVEFTIKEIKGVKFVSIWGTRSRNNFPTQPDLDEILKQI